MSEVESGLEDKSEEELRKMILEKRELT